jgi:hypothetical protein
MTWLSGAVMTLGRSLEVMRFIVRIDNGRLFI